MALTPMDTKTTAIFEVTPMHPTRNVTDKVLYKDNGKSYEVEMTATQAKAAAKTCKDIKIAVDGSYYPVTPATTDDAVVSAIAGEAPADVEAVEAGKRAFGSYFHSVKEDDEILGKVGKDFGEVFVEGFGARGHLAYIANFTDYSNEENRQNGYFFPFAYESNEEYTEVTYKVITSGDDAVECADLNAVWVGATAGAAAKAIIEFAGKDADGNDVKGYIKMTNIACDAKIAAVGSPEAEAAEDATAGGSTQGDPNQYKPVEKNTIGAGVSAEIYMSYLHRENAGVKNGATSTSPLWIDVECDVSEEDNNSPYKSSATSTCYSDEKIIQSVTGYANYRNKNKMLAPGDKCKYMPYIKNNGTVDAYVRYSLLIPSDINPALNDSYFTSSCKSEFNIDAGSGYLGTPVTHKGREYNKYVFTRKDPLPAGEISYWNPWGNLAFVNTLTEEDIAGFIASGSLKNGVCQVVSVVDAINASDYDSADAAFTAFDAAKGN